MSLRYVPFVVGEYYHVYNRGNHKREIFLDKQDYQRFQRLLYLCNSNKNINFRDVRDSKVDFFKYDRGTPLVAIGAYCLMPNHFHILSTPLVEKGLSQFMRKLCTGYSMYFNKRYQATGSLYEGKFKASYVDTDVYLKYLYSYIHLNPMKLFNSNWKTKDVNNKEIDFLNKYEYSSFKDYVFDTREETSILTKNSFPEYFSNKKDHLIKMIEWLSPRKDLGEMEFDAR